MKENSWRVSRQIMPKKDSFLVFSGADSASFTSLFTTLPLTVASAAATDGNHLNAIDLT